MGAGYQESRPRPWYRKAWILWIVLLLLAIGAYLVLHGRGAADSTKPATSGSGRGQTGGPVTLTTATATKGSIGIYLDAIGTVTPVYTASITAQASGVLTAVHYSEGQYVQKGDALIDIDPRPYQAQLLEAQGALERDTNLLAQAQMDLDRYRTAWARNGINKQLLDDQEKIVLQDQGTVKNDQGTVNYDQVQLELLPHYRADFRPGGSSPGGPRKRGAGRRQPPCWWSLPQVQPITVIFTLAEDSLGQVQARMRQMHTLPVEAWDRAQTTKIAAGKLLTIDNQIDTTTGTVKLRALFDNKNGALFPNQFVNTRLLVNTLDGVTLVPSRAVQHNGQVAFLYVITNGVASVRNITTGVADGGMTAVEGINPGEVVATSSFEKLQNGSKVVVAKQAAAANASGGQYSVSPSGPFIQRPLLPRC